MVEPETLTRLAGKVRLWCAFVGARRLVSGVVSAAAVAVVMWFVFAPSPVPVEDVMPLATVPTVATSAAPTVVTVHVAGAVSSPGVYSLAPGSRVADAITAAGGATARADLVRINLAQVVHDTEQVFVPARQSSSRAPAVTVAPRHQPTTTVPSAPGSDASGSTGPVNLNTASEAELDALPGIGPATATAIIVHRRERGMFESVEDLLNVPGIGPSKLAALAGLVTVG